MLDSYNVKLEFKVDDKVITESHWVTTRNKSAVLEAARKAIIEKYGVNSDDIKEVERMSI